MIVLEKISIPAIIIYTDIYFVNPINKRGNKYEKEN